ncbi:kynureninase, partial [candidate division KSB1 bacterium]|nr:kynureninase [candidate division KSB1 bacterium]
DREEPLPNFRRRFHLPQGVIYMDGNSLGLPSKAAEASLLKTLAEWKRLGIRGWLEGDPPWFYLAETLGDLAAPLVGAQADEVVATGTTTVNIHALISTFYQSQGKRRKILADALDFPTDIYALKGQLALRGMDADVCLELVPAADGRFLDERDIAARMTDETALVFLPSVLYRSGQLLDMLYLVHAAHHQGIPIGFDCSHSVGAVPHYFDQWGVDFAVWCGYKYLNGGPGCSAFLYINRRHFNREPLLAGWFGCVKDKQFDMSLDFEHQHSAGGWQISSPGILGSSTLLGSLEIVREAGMEAIRRKSLSLTSYLIYLVDALLSEPPYSFRIGTPREPERRGGHIALERNEEAWRICEALKARGVVPDFRPPDIIRIAPVALYNTYSEVWQVVRHLREIIMNEEYGRFSPNRKAIS